MIERLDFANPNKQLFTYYTNSGMYFKEYYSNKINSLDDDNLTASEIRDSLKVDIEKYFNNVTIKDITIDQSETVNNLTINISFIYTNLYNTIDDNITFVFGV
jgi:hypothetical protein